MLRNYSNTVDPTSLSAALNNSSVTVNVASTTGFPAVPFVGAIDRGTPDEEVLLVTAKTSTTFTVSRGFDGTAAVAHLSGAAFEHVTAAIEYSEANLHINDSARDDHPQYFNLTRTKVYLPQSFVGSSPINVTSITTTNKQCNSIVIPAESFSRKVQFIGTGQGVGLSETANYWFTIRHVSSGDAVPGGAATSRGSDVAMFTTITKWAIIPPGVAWTVGTYIRRTSGTGGQIDNDVNLNSLSALVLANV